MTDEEITRKFQDVDNRVSSNTARIDALEAKSDGYSQMLASIARIGQRQDDMDADLKEIKSDVKTLTEKPARRWDSIVSNVILAVVGALVAPALAVFGLS